MNVDMMLLSHFVKHGELHKNEMDRINKIPVTDGLKETILAWRSGTRVNDEIFSYITAALKQVKQLEIWHSETYHYRIYTTWIKME